MGDKQNAFMRAPIDYLCGEATPTEAQVAYVFATLRQHGRDGGTYRYLIYDLLGFGESAYTPLYVAGGMELSNLFCARDERDALQSRIEAALEEAANGIEFSMHGGRGGYVTRLCRIMEILRGESDE